MLLVATLSTGAKLWAGARADIAEKQGTFWTPSPAHDEIKHTLGGMLAEMEKMPQRIALRPAELFAWKDISFGAGDW